MNELALALNRDEAGGFKFLDVVRERGRRNGQHFHRLGAAHGARGTGDALNELQAPRVGEGLEDRDLPGAAERDGLLLGLDY